MRGPTKYDRSGITTGTYYRKRERAALSDDPRELATHGICSCSWCIFGWEWDIEPDDGWRDESCWIDCECAKCIPPMPPSGPLTVPLWAALH